MTSLFRFIFVGITACVWYAPGSVAWIVVLAVWVMAVVVLDRMSGWRSFIIAIPASSTAFFVVWGLEYFIGGRVDAAHLAAIIALKWFAALAASGYLISGRLADDLVLISIRRGVNHDQSDSALVKFASALSIPFGWVEHQLPRQMQSHKFRSGQQSLRIPFIGFFLGFLLDLVLSMVERFENLAETLKLKSR